MKPINIYWENPNNKRFYSVELRKDLLEDWILTKINGRVGTRLGKIRKIFCKSYQDGFNEIKAVAELRKKHGYLIID